MIQLSKVLSVAVAILGLNINPAQGQEASTYCRRWDHQSVVLDDKLYLFGGRKLYLEHIQDPDDEAYNGGAGVPSNDFMVLDLSKPWQLEKDKVLTNPPKWEPINASWIEGHSPPGIAGGGLFTYKHKGESGILLYDGKYYPLETESENPKDRKSQCVSFSAESNEWKLQDAWSNPQSDIVESRVVSRFSRGTAVDVPDQNTGFYVGGARIWEWEEDYDWYYPDGVQLAQVDFDGTGIVRKMKPLPDYTKSIAPSAVWVPIGEKGSLIIVGGTKEEDDDRLSAFDRNDNPNAQYERPTKMRSFDKTLIYDIAKDEWYEQDTRGVPLPGARQNACLVHRSFQEPNGNITHQLFLYGGGSGSSFGLGDPLDDMNFYGDLYVLSIPGFRWLQFTSIPHAPNARTRQTCHVVNERHLFVVGGGRNDSLKDDPGLKFACVWDDLSVLDMTKMEWLLEYTPNKDPYEVNNVIRKDSLYKDSPRTEPEAGWSPGVQEWFQSQYPPKNDTKGNDPGGKENENENETKKGDNKLALIIGVVVGCFVALLLGMLARCYWLRRRKVINSDDPNATGLGIGTTGQPDMVNSFTPVEMSTDSDVYQSDHSFGWGGTGSPGYTPVPMLIDENGPYTFNTAGGQVYAAELEGHPIMSSSLLPAELQSNSATSGSYDRRDTPHRHSSFAVRNSMAHSSATETTGFMESSSTPISPYLPSESSSPLGTGEPHHIRWRMTEEDSNRISRDVEELMRVATTSPTSENDEKKLIHPAFRNS